MPATTRRPRRKARSPESAPSATSLGADDDQQQQQQQVELLIARRDDSSEYLVKWKGTSYRQLEWVKKVTLLDKFPMALQRMRHFDAKHPGSEYEFPSKPLPPTSPRKSGIHAKSDQDSLLERLVERDIVKAEWLQMESVATFREIKGGDKEWLVKWGSLPLTQGTWEEEVLSSYSSGRIIVLESQSSVPEDLIEDWRNFNDRRRKAHLKPVTARRPKDASETWYAKNVDDVAKASNDDGGGAGGGGSDDAHKFYYKPIGEQLFDFQVEGIQWLLYNWAQYRGSILADEMGLGKTVQSSVFISAVHELTGGVGPCLVVAPLSTLTHWKRELAKWAPALRTVVFHGSQEERPLIQEYLLNWIDLDNGCSIKEKNAVKGKIGYKPKFDVMVASYETLIQSPSAFNCYHWRLLIMDEGHRLKGVDSLAKKVICNRNKMKVDHHLLLTGTPIQNNLQELWSVLNVVDHKTFDNWDAFAEEYGSTPSSGQATVMTEEGATALVEVMKPYILRRHKTDVMKQVPPKEEVVVSVEFTRMQRKVYRSVYEKSFCQLAAANTGGGIIDTSKYRNICMQLRKCLAHPYLLDDVEDAHIQANQPSIPDISSEELEMKSLVEMSGKMVFLDKLLPRLMETQQKVLVFSQMTRALDVIEDYLLWKGYKYERLDGNVSGAQRQEAIDRFNDTSLGTGDAAGPYKQQQPWIFLLSTRAGGVGINLTAANVVVIYDSDWNPQNDMQAQARCHRIGQKKEVKVYRLITRDSYEERMFDVASKKLGLEQALMSGVTKNSKLELSRKELQDLIKRGAYAAFEEDDANQQSTSDGFLAATIDDILSSERTKTVRYGTVVAGGQRSAFSKATFVANEADLERDENEEKENAQKQEPLPQRINIDDADFWQKLAGEDFDRLVSQGMADPGTRRKQVVSYVQPSWADYKRMEEGAREGILTYAEQVAMNKIVKLGAPWTDKDTRHRLRDFLLSGAYGHWSAMRSYVMGSEDMTPQPSPSESSASSFSPDSDDDDYGDDTPQQQQQQPYGGDGGLDEGQCEVLMVSFIGLLIKIIVLRAERSVNSEEEDDDDSDYIPDGASSTAGSTAEETLLDQLEWLFDLSILKAVGEDLKIIASDGLNGNERCWNRLWERLKLEGRRTGDGDSEDAVVFDGIGALLTSRVSPVVAYLFPQWGRIVDGSMKSEEKMDYIDQAAEDAQKMINTIDAIHGIVTLVAPTLPSSDTPFITCPKDVSGEVPPPPRAGTKVDAFHRVDEEWQPAILKQRHSDGTCEVEWLERSDQCHRFIASALVRRSGDEDYYVDTGNEPKWMKRSALGVATARIRQWWTCDDDRDLMEAAAASSGLQAVLRKPTHKIIPYDGLTHRLEQLKVWYNEEYHPPSHDFIISRVKALWRGWKEAQDINIWTRPDPSSRELLKGFVRLTLRHGVPPSVLDPVIRKIPGTKSDLVSLMSSGSRRSSPVPTASMHPLHNHQYPADAAMPVVHQQPSSYAMPPPGAVPIMGIRPPSAAAATASLRHGSSGLPPPSTSTYTDNTSNVLNIPPPWRSSSIIPNDLLNLRQVKQWCAWVIDTIVPRTLQSYCSPSGVLQLTKAYLEILRCAARDEPCSLDDPDEPITSKVFEDAGLSFASSLHPTHAKKAARQYLRILHLHHVLRVLVFYQNSPMNWYPHLTGSLREPNITTSSGAEGAILSYIMDMCRSAGMGGGKCGEIALTLSRVLTRGIRTSRGLSDVEMRLVQSAFMPFKDAAVLAEGRMKAEVARRKKIEAEPPVSEKWGNHGRTEAMVKVIRKLGVPQQLWSPFVDVLKEYRPSCSTSRTRVGFRKPLNDKASTNNASSPFGDDEDGKFDGTSAWDYIFSCSQGIKSDKALQARFVGCTKLKPWSKAAIEELGTLSRKNPPLKAQDCIDFACVYLWELAKGLRRDTAADDDDDDDDDGLTTKNPFHDTMFIPFTPLDIGIGHDQMLPLVGKDKDVSLIEEFEELQVKASLQGVFGKFPNPPAQSTLTLEDIFKKKLDELLERLNNFTIIDPNTHRATPITWWSREIHDRALLACVIVHGMPSGWEDEEVLGSDQLPFFYWARRVMVAEGESNSRSRRRCNDGSIKQEGSLAHRAYHYLINTIKPAMRDRILGITAQIELAVKNKAAKAKSIHNTAVTALKKDINHNKEQSYAATVGDNRQPAPTAHHGLSLVSMSSKGPVFPAPDPYRFASIPPTNPVSVPKRKRQDLLMESAAAARRTSIPSPDLKRSRPTTTADEPPSEGPEIIEISDSR